jgi:rod shape-determining protein MreB and related proteins
MNDIIYIQIKAKELTLKNVTQAIVYRDIPLLMVRRQGKSFPVLAYGKEVLQMPQPSREAFIVNGFDHPRSIIGDYEAAEKTLTLFLPKVDGRKNKWLPYAPMEVIMHPLEKLDGGLTTAEKRALQDMAFRAKTRKMVRVWEGRELTDQEILNHQFPAEGKLFPAII